MLGNNWWLRASLEVLFCFVSICWNNDDLRLLENPSLPSLWEWGPWGATEVSIFSSPHGRVRCGRRLDLCGVTSLRLQGSMSLNPVLKRGRCGLRRAGSRASVQSPSRAQRAQFSTGRPRLLIHHGEPTWPRHEDPCREMHPLHRSLKRARGHEPRASELACLGVYIFSQVSRLGSGQACSDH